jgi:hypothetical protein
MMKVFFLFQFLTLSIQTIIEVRENQTERLLPCAGWTNGGAIGLSLNFLFLFFSRKKEK